MPLLLDSSLSLAQSRVVETQRGVFFNSQYYDKATMLPIPFESFAVNGTPRTTGAQMTWNQPQSTSVNNTWYAGVQIDPDDPDICYTVSPNAQYSSGGYSQGLKITERPGKLPQVQIVYPSTASDYGPPHLFAVLGNFLVVMFYHTNGNGYMQYLYKNLASSATAITNRAYWVMAPEPIIKTSASRIYALTWNWTNPNQIYSIIQFDCPTPDSITGLDVTASISNLNTLPTAANSYLLRFQPHVINDDPTHCHFYRYRAQLSTDSNTYIAVEKISIDMTDTANWVCSSIKYTLEETPESAIPAVSTQYYQIENWELKDGDDTYIVISPCINAGNSHVGFVPQPKMMVYKLDDEAGTMVLQQRINVALGSYAYALFPVTPDKKTMVLATYPGTYLYHWSSDTKQYVNTAVKAYAPLSVSVGMDQTIYIVDYNYKLEILRADSPTTMVITMEDTSYVYEGSPITTSVKVSAIDGEGNYTVTSAKLTCGIGAVFVSTGTREAIVMTSASGPIDVTMTINTGTSFGVWAAVN